jgi:hypothetical protein
VLIYQLEDLQHFQQFNKIKIVIILLVIWLLLVAAELIMLFPAVVVLVGF